MEGNDMLIIALSAIVLAIIGNYLYCRNALQVELGVFSATPWFIFFLLGANDCANYLATNSNWFEIVAGLIVMMGPLMIFTIIVLKGKKEGRVNLKTSSEEKLLILFAMTSVLVITVLEILAEKGLLLVGASPYFEWSALVFAFALDGVAVLALKGDIDETPEEFELWSWSCFLLASVLASYFDLLHMWNSLNTIAFLLIAENILVSYLAIRWILKARK